MTWFFCRKHFCCKGRFASAANTAKELGFLARPAPAANRKWRPLVCRMLVSPPSLCEGVVHLYNVYGYSSDDEQAPEKNRELAAELACQPWQSTHHRCWWLEL
eukprot:793807-Amphidinium_carterae.3